MKNVDFLPEQMRVQRARRQRVVRQVYLLALCALGLALLGYLRQGRVRKANAELAMLNERACSVNQQLAKRNELEQQLAELMITKRIEEHIGSRVNALDVMSELGRLLPKSIFLTSMNIETMDVRIPVSSTEMQSSENRAVIAGSPQKKERIVKRVRLVITGLAPTDVDVANFIGQLSASPLFEDVNMGYARNMTFNGRAAREFQASCYVVR